MTDIAIFVDENGEFDLAISERDLQKSEGLENAILISLFTDARANDDDILPNNDTDKRGWWGDGFASEINGLARPIGSKLWLLSRSKITSETINKVRDYSQAALKWLVDDGIAKSIEITPTRVDPHTISILVIITKPSGEIFKFEKLWSTINGVAT